MLHNKKAKKNLMTTPNNLLRINLKSLIYFLVYVPIKQLYTRLQTESKWNAFRMRLLAKFRTVHFNLFPTVLTRERINSSPCRQKWLHPRFDVSLGAPSARASSVSKRLLSKRLVRSRGKVNGGDGDGDGGGGGGGGDDDDGRCGRCRCHTNENGHPVCTRAQEGITVIYTG